jgi:predicted TIM-barrel fold metal-dependent hydrolase
VNPEELILVSVDDHIAEPADMFAGHVPDRYRSQAPRVVLEPDGVEQWYYGDVRGRNLGLNAVAGKSPEFYNIDASRYDEMRPGCYDVHERVRDMNAGGQLAGLNFPNWPGFSGQVLSQGPDRHLNDIMIGAYNDWHVDEWCGAYPERFIPCGILPLYDVERAATEVRRLAAKGCHAVTFSENPEALGMASIHSHYWDPLFAACSDEGTVLCCHVGSSSQTAHTSADAPASVAISLSSVASIFTMVDLIWCDAFARFPELRFSLTEGDVGWIPYFLWRSEHVGERHHGWTGHTFPDGISGPAEVFRRNILCCFISDPVGIENLSHFNVDNVCWESDYPHSDGVWPNGPEVLGELLAGVSDEVVEAITHGNAMRHYQFDPFARRPPDACRVGALRAESPDVDTVTRVGRPAGERDRRAWARIANRVAAAKAGRRPAATPAELS